MRLSTFAVLAASAALAHVSAAPAVRLIVVSTSVEDDNPLNGVRFGHAVQPMPPYRNVDDHHELLNFSPPPATQVADSPPTPGKGPDGYPAPPKRFRQRPGCHGKKGKFAIFMHRIKIKAIKVGNCFRKALGWPSIELDHHHRHHHHHHHGQPPHHGKDEKKDQGAGSIIYWTGVPDSSQDHPQPEGGHSEHQEHQHTHFRKHRGSFLSRLHHSLMNLGRWEGRAVAFVIGCGIGVLIRMFWVLAIVSYRACRGNRDDGYATFAVMEEYDSDDETVVSPKVQPPKYIYPVDEKIAVQESN